MILKNLFWIRSEDIKNKEFNKVVVFKERKKILRQHPIKNIKKTM